MDNDVSTAATISDLRQQLDAARKDNEFMRGYINNEDVRSDFRTVTEMRAALDAARAVLETSEKANTALYTAKAKLIEERDVVQKSLEHMTMRFAEESMEHLQTLRELDAARADAVRITGERDAARQALNDTDIELAKAMSRADVLAAEVRAYREWQRTKCDDNASSLDHWHACKALDEATWNTDSTHALDAGKFEVQP